MKGERDTWALRLGEGRQLRNARWRDTNELAVGRTSTTSASSASLGARSDRGLTGALPARELSDIVAQLARSLAAEAAVSDYAYPDVRENSARA